jgi:hypothetical protein
VKTHRGGMKNKAASMWRQRMKMAAAHRRSHISIEDENIGRNERRRRNRNEKVKKRKAIMSKWLSSGVWRHGGRKRNIMAENEITKYRHENIEIMAAA